MAIRESLLDALSSIATSDFVRSVTAAGASSKVTVSNLAKAIVENYTGSTLAGTAQSVKSAIDALDSKTTLPITYTSNRYVTSSALANSCAVKVGNLYRLTFNIDISNFPSGSAYDNTEIGQIQNWSTSYSIYACLAPQKGTTSNGILLVSVSSTGKITISNRSGLPCDGFYRMPLVTH